MKRLLLAFLAASIHVGCGSVGIGNDPERKPKDENTADPAEAQQAQTEMAETKPAEETDSTNDTSEIAADSADTTEALPDGEPESSLPVVYMTSDCILT